MLKKLLDTHIRYSYCTKMLIAFCSGHKLVKKPVQRPACHGLGGERKILFKALGTQQGPKALTKMECLRHAADAIFSHSADINEPCRIDGGFHPLLNTCLLYNYIRHL